MARSNPIPQEAIRHGHQQFQREMVMFPEYHDRHFPLTHIPVHKGSLGVHEVKLVVNPRGHLGRAGRVSNHAGSPPDPRLAPMPTASPGAAAWYPPQPPWDPPPPQQPAYGDSYGHVSAPAAPPPQQPAYVDSCGHVSAPAVGSRATQWSDSISSASPTMARSSTSRPSHKAPSFATPTAGSTHWGHPTPWPSASATTPSTGSSALSSRRPPCMTTIAGKTNPVGPAERGAHALTPSLTTTLPARGNHPRSTPVPPPSTGRRTPSSYSGHHLFDTMSEWQTALPPPIDHQLFEGMPEWQAQVFSLSYALDVCEFFTDQYYSILYTNPEGVLKFYHDSSWLSRPESNGAPSSVTKLQAISGKIRSFHKDRMSTEIEIDDVQELHEGGISIRVTGYFTRYNYSTSRFVQSFLLVPQGGGYVVGSDVLSYMDEHAPREPSSLLADPSMADAPENKNDEAEFHMASKLVGPVSVLQVDNAEETPADSRTSDSGQGVSQRVHVIPSDHHDVCQVVYVQSEVTRLGYISSKPYERIRIFQLLQEIYTLQNELWTFEGVEKLGSDAAFHILGLTTAAMLDDLPRLATVVARLGRRCSESALSGFEHICKVIRNRQIDEKQLGIFMTTMDNMLRKKKSRYVIGPSSLYIELAVMHDLEQATINQQNHLEKSHNGFAQKVIWQMQAVAHLKELSLWNQSFDTLVDLSTRPVCTIYSRFSLLFGASIMGFKVSSSREEFEFSPLLLRERSTQIFYVVPGIPTHVGISGAFQLNSINSHSRVLENIEMGRRPSNFRPAVSSERKDNATLRNGNFHFPWVSDPVGLFPACLILHCSALVPLDIDCRAPIGTSSYYCAPIGTSKASPYPADILAQPRDEFPKGEAFQLASFLGTHLCHPLLLPLSFFLATQFSAYGLFSLEVTFSSQHVNIPLAWKFFHRETKVGQRNLKWHRETIEVSSLQPSQITVLRDTYWLDFPLQLIFQCATAYRRPKPSGVIIYAVCYLHLSEQYYEHRTITNVEMVLDIAKQVERRRSEDDAIPYLTKGATVFVAAHTTAKKNLTRQEKSQLLECENQVDKLLASIFENYKSLDEASLSGLSDIFGLVQESVAPALVPAIHVFTLLHDILSHEAQAPLQTYRKTAAGKRCRRHMLETDEFLSGNNEGLVMDPMTISTAYLKMKTLCTTIGNEIPADIKIHNQYILPSSIDLPDIATGVYSTELCNRLRCFLSACPPSSPWPCGPELLVATADFERDLQSWDTRPVQGGMDSKNLFNYYIMVWIDDKRLCFLELCKADKGPWSGIITHHSTSPFVEDMYDRMRDMLNEYAVVVNRWPQYALHFENAIARVERAVVTTMEKQFSDILTPLKDRIPKKLGIQVQRLTRRQPPSLYIVSNQLGTFLSTVKRILEVLHFRLEDILNQWGSFMPGISDRKSAFRAQLNGSHFARYFVMERFVPWPP